MLTQRLLGPLFRRSFGAPVAEPMPRAFDDLLGELDRRTANAGRYGFATDLIALAPRLRAYARSLTRDSHAADDLVQDTMLRAWKARGGFESGSNLRAWTFTILRNIFLSDRRQDRFVGQIDEDLVEQRLATSEAQSGTVALGEVERAMAVLPDQQREALRLIGVEGLPYQEAARRLGIATGTMKSRVSRARTALQAILAGKGPTSGTIPPDRRSARPVKRTAGRDECVLWIG